MKENENGDFMKKVIVYGNNNVAEMLYLETQKYNEKHLSIEAFF